MYIGKTTLGAVVAGARSCPTVCHVSTTARKKNGPPAPTGHRMRWAKWPGLLLTSAHVYGREKKSTSGASVAQNTAEMAESATQETASMFEPWQRQVRRSVAARRRRVVECR